MATRPTVRGAKPTTASNESDWQQRTELFAQDMTEEYKSYPTVTAMDLRSRKERPRRVKMLMRDFIEGVLCTVAPGPGWRDPDTTKPG